MIKSRGMLRIDGSSFPDGTENGISGGAARFSVFTRVRSEHERASEWVTLQQLSGQERTDFFVNVAQEIDVAWSPRNALILH